MTIFIGNLPLSVPDSEILKLVGVPAKISRSSHGHTALVNIADDGEALEVMRRLNGYLLRDRKIFVQVSHKHSVTYHAR